MIYWACPCGSGYPLQVLAALRAFRCYPSRKMQMKKKKVKNEKSDELSTFQDIPGFCKSATIEDIRKNNYILTPGRYIDFKEVKEDEQAFEEKMQQLTATLREQMQKANELDEAIKQNLAKIGYEI